MSTISIFGAIHGARASAARMAFPLISRLHSFLPWFSEQTQQSHLPMTLPSPVSLAPARPWTVPVCCKAETVLRCT